MSKNRTVTYRSRARKDCPRSVRARLCFQSLAIYGDDITLHFQMRNRSLSQVRVLSGMSLTRLDGFMEWFSAIMDLVGILNERNVPVRRHR
jgi:hypothetical protein